MSNYQLICLVSWGNMNVEKTVIAGKVLADNADGADIADFILKLFYKSLAAR